MSDVSSRVLVVEDDPDIGRLVTLQLSELDCRFLRALKISPD